MTLSVEECLSAIEHHTRGLATAAEGHLQERVEHCPDWSVADLVWHVAQVHWFWTQVALLRPAEEPEDLVGPDRPAEGDLIATLLLNMAAMVDILRAADQSAACWTWGLEQNVGFITRHQVQEAAIHHWDATNATGVGHWELSPVVALDGVEEFLTHSVANTRWPMTQAEPLGAPLVVPVEGALITISDGAEPGTLAHTVTTGDHHGNTAADVLLWLYRRIPEAQIAAEPRDALSRFSALRSTD